MIENKIIDMKIHVDGRMDVSILIGTEIWTGTVVKDMLETDCYWKDMEEASLKESRDIRKVIRYQVIMLTNESYEDTQIRIKESIMSLLRTTQELDAPHLRGKTYTQTIEALTTWLDGFGDGI